MENLIFCAVFVKETHLQKHLVGKFFIHQYQVTEKNNSSILKFQYNIGIYEN